MTFPSSSFFAATLVTADEAADQKREIERKRMSEVVNAEAEVVKSLKVAVVAREKLVVAKAEQ